MHQAGLHLFATIYDESGLDAAKEYISRMGYDSQSVRIHKSGNTVSVISKVPFDSNFNPIPE